MFLNMENTIAIVIYKNDFYLTNIMESSKTRLQSIEKHLKDNCNYEWICTTPKYIEFKSETILLQVNKDMSDFTLFLTDETIVTTDEIWEKRNILNEQISDSMGIMNILIEWIKEKQDEAINEEVDGFDDTGDFLEEARPLPKYECDETRQLKIYVWGRKKRKHLPHKVDHNFNAAVLHGKKKGTNWRKDGRTLEIREAVKRCVQFNEFLTVMLRLIETKKMSKIGINCRAGRHRSVTLAWVLQESYYPNAKIIYLEI
jgi:hypothetical protein